MAARWSKWVTLALLASAVMGVERSRGALVATGNVEPLIGSWTSSDTAVVGHTANGSVTINGGSHLSAKYAYLGYNSLVSGTATIDGFGSGLTVGNSLQVGVEGTGTLNINNLATVTVGGVTQIGSSTSFGVPNGTLNFGGTGGTLTTDALFISPASVTGMGTINTSGLVTDGNLTFDATHGLTQTFNWTAPGQNVRVNLNENATHDLGVGYLQSGTLNISGGFKVASSTMYLGVAAGSTGTASVAGVGSRWSGNTIYVGQYGTGVLMVSNGGTVVSVTSYMGERFFGTGTAVGTVTVDGTLSTWTTGGIDMGAGQLNITNGGAVICTGGISIGEDSTGTATIDGASSKLSIKGNLVLGYQSDSSTHASGTLNISGGTSVNVTGTTYLGDGGGTGKMNFGPGGGTLTSGVLYSPMGQVLGTGTINTQGLIYDGNILFDAAHLPSQPLRWNGPGQNITMNLDLSNYSEYGVGTLAVGYTGIGTLTVHDGVKVSCATGAVGGYSGSNGTADISGTGSTWTVRGILYIGSSPKIPGTAALTVSQGATVNCYSTTFDVGKTVISGPGSKWNITNSADIGTAFLRIDSGGILQTGSMAVSGGTMTVTGAGSGMLISGSFDLGFFNYTKASVSIMNGAVFSSSQNRLGNYGPASVRVDGPGSAWNSASYITVGYATTGSLFVSGGGILTVNTLNINSSDSLLSMTVGDGTTVNAGSSEFSNSGTLRLKAVPDLATGSVYHPVGAGSFTGTGVVQALGGKWDSSAHTFTVSAVTNTASGTPATIDRTTTQRVKVTDAGTGDTTWAGFMASSTSVTLTATPVASGPRASLQSSSGSAVLGAWTYSATGATAGEPVMISLVAAPGSLTENLSVWIYNGSAWSPYGADDLSFDGRYGNFTINSFGSYALTETLPVPEPGSLVILMVGGLTLWRRKRSMRRGHS